MMPGNDPAGKVSTQVQLVSQGIPPSSKTWDFGTLTDLEQVWCLVGKTVFWEMEVIISFRGAPSPTFLFHHSHYSV